MKTTRVFKSGNSLAVRLPKSFGMAEGTEVVLREEQGRYVVEPVPATPEKIDLTGIYGSIPGLQPLTPEEREIEERELDWEGRQLKRG